MSAALVIPPREEWPVAVISGRACPCCRRGYCLVRIAIAVPGRTDIKVCEECAARAGLPLTRSGAR